MNKKLIIGIIAVIVVIIASVAIYKDSKSEDMKPKYSQKDMDKLIDQHFNEQQELKTQIKELKSKVDSYEKEQTRSLQKTTQPSQETPKPQEQPEQEQPKKEDTAAKETVKTVDWGNKVKEVASSDKSTTEKFDEVSKYAQGYKPSKDEVKQFGDEIIKEYKDKNYIKDVSNHEYMLNNLFKSQVVDKNASDKNLKDFAFDFWQNSKYNYRGVENATSSATQANERQMDKALSKMNK
ncbi:TPA: hypothetical protein QC445_004617 [Bacillus cereus]|uniref:hypothetical protein n=1 Tax=Bacillus cereus group TaxID=86661 RepID=UPI000BF47AA8|nr:MULTISPECIES: hypothetical protein [Bacillus cereus group]KAA6458866.1 hypothetical protein DX930_27765 [Bacillus cereus]KAA6470345.1 hypothetical protein DX931_28260 [Bacillus cereus]KAB2412588.1 hypothetical protein F8169_30955 [Bacillus cereus]KAB2435221.1 hypothetical protein F8166_18290 [Bacillus cereus]KAB2461685.1 hypothetical protein F8164_30685 [Bacillus cereus]